MTVGAESREFVPDGFDLQRLVGRGASSVVWEAVQASTGRAVALKLLDVDLTDDRDRRRFDREREVMGVLATHPAIVTIFDAGVQGGRPWIAMELCRRGSLAAALHEHGSLSGERAVRVLVAMADALAVVHDHGIVHCDVKPANILVTDFGEPTLTDFGIARGNGIAASTTMGGYTLDHVSPEVLDNQPHSAASDVYSLGTTVWQLLSDRPPFREDADSSLAAVMRRILTEPLPDLGVDDPPDDLVALLGRMTAKSPADRPASMKEVHADARRILARIGGQDGPTFPPVLRPEPPPARPGPVYLGPAAEMATRDRSAGPVTAGGPDDNAQLTHLRATASDGGAGPAKRRPILLIGTAVVAVVVAAGAGSWGLGLLDGRPGSGDQATSAASVALLPTSSPTAAGSVPAAVTATVTAGSAGPSVPALPAQPAQPARPAPPVPAAAPAPVPAPNNPVQADPGPTQPAPVETAQPLTEMHRSVVVSSQVPVSSVDGGVDTGIALESGRTLALSASGTVEYGYDGGACVGVAQTDPDGRRTVGGQQCDVKYDPNVPLPSAPVGALIGRIGQGGWFLVGSSQSMSADSSGELWLAHNDFSPSDNHGSYSVDITVSG